MAFTLNNFYQSKEWTGLMQIIKQARLNDDGQLICEHCGKSIIKVYDCIGHHKIELTEQNVNDYNISLNADNIMLVHHKCHSIIHDRLGMSGDRRQIYLVYGPPLCGKHAWVKENMSAGDLIIDMDNIWQCVSGCDRYTKPNRLNSIVFGLRDYLLDSVHVRRGKWLNAYIIGGYPLISERQRLCRELGAREIFIEATEDECLVKLTELDDGRNLDEWYGYITKWFQQYGPPLS